MSGRKYIHIVTCLDQDGLRIILSAWSSVELADEFIDKFIELHKDDPFWRLDDIVIESIVLDESKF